MVSSFGFDKIDTPPVSVQEFYRQQGELRAKETIISLINDYQHPNTQHDFNDEFCDGLVAFINSVTEQSQSQKQPNGVSVYVSDRDYDQLKTAIEGENK